MTEKVSKQPESPSVLVRDMTQDQMEKLVEKQLEKLLVADRENGKIRSEESKTFAEFLLETGLTKKEHNVESISLGTPMVKYNKKNGEKPKFKLYLPLMTAAMQAVTGPEMMERAAQLGFMGTCFCSQSIKDEANMIREVKKARAGFVVPDCFSPKNTLDDVIRYMRENKGRSTFPVTKDGTPDGKLVGLITRYGVFEKEDGGKGIKIKDRMSCLKELKQFGTVVKADNLKTLNRMMYERGKKFLMVVDYKEKLKYMIFRKDLDQTLENPHALIDKKEKRYIVSAAINTHDYRRRVPKLLEAGADILVIDSSDGYSEWQRDVLRYMGRKFPDVPVMGGNIINKEAFRYLVEHGAWAVKVGMGGGSICITREQKGTGKGQANAVYEVCQERDKYYEETGIYMPVISDGGIVVSKDIVTALAIGADAVMMGRYFARFEESPTEIDERTGMKPYWGEGTRRAWAWMKKRYGHTAFEEGVDGFVPFLGKMEKTVEDTILKMKHTMISTGCMNIQELHKNAKLIPMSPMTMREGQPHDVVWTDPLGSYKEREWGV